VVKNRYTDQELDAENGLYNYNARLYDPFIGRFISPDTIVPQPFNPQSLNRYSYVLNNPLIYTDPSGHSNYCSDPSNPCDEFVLEEIVVKGKRPSRDSRPELMDLSMPFDSVWNPLNGEMPPWIEAQWIEMQMQLQYLYGGGGRSGSGGTSKTSGGGGLPIQNALATLMLWIMGRPLKLKLLDIG
jgi:RHS repeat-associated protein